LTTSFSRFGLAEPITRALCERMYVTPTPIQIETIPIVLSHRDVVAIAQTGTGKTAAFALPILHHLFSNRRRPERKTCRVLVLSPTRELSGQILDSFTAYGRHLNVSATLAIGGVSMNAQVRALSGGVDVLVATPGRLLDLMQNNAVHLDAVEYFVLDEADRMLDMGFIHDIRKIASRLPSRRQTLLFSATMPSAIYRLAQQLLREPVKIAVTPEGSTVDRVRQSIVRVDRGAKAALLVQILKREAIERAIVFTRTKHGADKVMRGLVSAGIPAQAIHGNKSQNHRERTLAAFRQGDVRALIATDIAARGIDVAGISHVINFDLPNVPETYVHRIGRTARAGAEGVAISLCGPDEVEFVRAIEKLIGMRIATSAETAVGVPRARPEPPRAKPELARGKQGPRRGQGNGHGRPQPNRPSHSDFANIRFLQPRGRPQAAASPGRGERDR
jgi:superfamily II DNA/RNA helicase